MRSLPTDFRRRDAAYLLIAALLVLLYTARAGSGFPLDDSWIHQVYARNLAERGEWAFVPGQPSAASTAPLYTVLLAAGYLIGLPYALWTHLLGIVALAIAGMLGARLSDRLSPGEPVTSFLTGAALVTAFHLIWAAASGMETMLFSTWTLALIWLTWREFDDRSAANTHVMMRGAVFGGAAALATLTRPEGAALAGICGLVLLIPGYGSDRRTFVLWGSGAALGFFILILPYLLLNLELTGGLLPATADAKYAQHAPLLEIAFFRRFLTMLIPVLVGGQFLLLPGAVYFIYSTLRRSRQDRRHLSHLLPALWVVALVALYAARLPAAYQHGRYVMPAMPSVIVMGIVGTAWLVKAGHSSAAGRVLSRSNALAAAAAFVYFGCILGPNIFRQDVRIIEEEMVAPARWIASTIPLGELLAVHDIGAVGYFAPRPILDIAGLVSPEVIPIVRDEQALWELLQSRDARYLMAFPDQVPGGDVSHRFLCPVYQSSGRASPSVGGPKMVIYRLAWDGRCVP